MIKYFIYCRKSTEEEERQILSIEAQLVELREYARNNGLTVVKEFTESKTAKDPGRPIFNQMLEELEKGNASGILAWNPDRLARNSIDGGRVIYLVDTCKIQSLKFPTFWFEPTPQGKFMLSVSFGQAKYYTDNLRENILRGVRQKLRRGEYPLKAPLGYVNEPRARTIVPHPEHFDKMKEVLEQFAGGGYTLTGIQRKMFSLGVVGGNGQPLPLSSIERILTNPFYYGVFRYGGELHQGKHQPMITKAVFDQIQKAMSDNGRARKKRPEVEYIFRGFARCGECGYMFTSEKHTKKNGLEFIYYRCSKRSKTHKCGSRFLRAENLAEQVKRNIDLVTLPDEWRDMFLEKVNELEKEESRSAGLGAQNLLKELAAVKDKLARLLDAHLACAVELEEYKEKKNELMDQKAGLEQRLLDFERRGDDRFELMRQFIISANHAKNLSSRSNYLEMRDLLKNIGSNQRITNGVLTIEFRKPWSYLASHSAEALAEGEGEARNGAISAGLEMSGFEPPTSCVQGRRSPD